MSNKKQKFTLRKSLNYARVQYSWYHSITPIPLQWEHFIILIIIFLFAIEERRIGKSSLLTHVTH